MRYLVFLLALSACGPDQSKFKTRCGLEFMGEVNTLLQVNGWDQEALQAVEDEDIKIFSRDVAGDPRFTSDNMCNQFKGFKIFVHPAMSWVDEYKRNISGVTFCLGRIVTVNNDTPFRGSLSHELAHVTQGCMAIQPPDMGSDADHANWSRDDIYKSIFKVEAHK